MSPSIIDVIGHYQRSIEKSTNDEARLLHCIEKLFKLPVTVNHLQQTGIGKTVNSLRKYDKEVGIAAKTLVAKWKAMVAAEQVPEEGEEDEANRRRHYEDDSHDDNQNKYNGNQNENNNSENKRRKEELKELDHKQKNTDANENGKSKYRENREKLESREKAEYREKSERREKAERREKSESREKSERREKAETRDRSHQSHSNERDRKLSKTSDRHNNDWKREEKHKSLKDISEKKDFFSKPQVQSSPEGVSDEARIDDDDEDDEKLVIDINKEKLEEEIMKLSQEPLKVIKPNRDSSSSKSNTNNRHHKESDHHSSSDRKNTSKKSSSDKSTRSIRTDSKDIQNQHQSDKETNKSSNRHNGEYKSSKSKHEEIDKAKEGKSRSKSSKRKHDTLEDCSPDSESEHKTPKKIRTIRKITTEGIDSSSCGFSFEEALGMIAAPSKISSKLKSPKLNGTTTNQTITSSSVFLTPSSSSSGSRNRSKTPPLLTSKVKLEPLDPKIAFELPTISPNYKPMPLNPTVMECVFSNNNSKPQKRLMSDEEALCAGISSKTIRTKIYSGLRTGACLQVGTLFDLCIRVLQKNIDALEYTGGVPFEVLKPVLERASPDQLQTFEEYNPYLIEDTDELWKHHCMRRYKNKNREELETWRDMFLRCKEELEERLLTLTQKVNFSQKNIAVPVRKTQLAYVDAAVKPPRNILRKQEQYGTKSNLVATPAARVTALSKIAPTIGKIGDAKLRIVQEIRDTAQATNNMRPRKAPLMQKSLQLMKGRFKR